MKSEKSFNMIRKEVLGFIFNEDLTKVLLVQKKRPTWQEGNHNGTGGMVGEDESATNAMYRHTLKETALDIKYWGWIHVGQMIGIDWEVVIYVARHVGPEDDAKTLTDEVIGWYDIKDLPEGLFNLDWLVPLSLDKFNNRSLHTVDIKYDI